MYNITCKFKHIGKRRARCAWIHNTPLKPFTNLEVLSKLRWTTYYRYIFPADVFRYWMCKMQYNPKHKKQYGTWSQKIILLLVMNKELKKENCAKCWFQKITYHDLWPRKQYSMQEGIANYITRARSTNETIVWGVEKTIKFTQGFGD
jgi:hypothetical protein